MLTMGDKQAKESATRQDKIKYCQDLIKAAARYERLLSYKDFNDLLDDLRRLATVHKEQIEGWLRQLEGAVDIDSEEAKLENPLLRQLRLMEVVKTHQYRMNQINEAVNYPDKIVALAVQAREELRSLLEEEKQHATRHLN